MWALSTAPQRQASAAAGASRTCVQAMGLLHEGRSLTRLRPAPPRPRCSTPSSRCSPTSRCSSWSTRSTCGDPRWAGTRWQWRLRAWGQGARRIQRRHTCAGASVARQGIKLVTLYLVLRAGPAEPEPPPAASRCLPLGPLSCRVVEKLLASPWRGMTCAILHFPQDLSEADRQLLEGMVAEARKISNGGTCVDVTR